MSVSKSELVKLADLCKLSFSDEELNQLTNEMESIIAFADTINNEVNGDTDNIRSVSFDAVGDDELREDVVLPSLDNEKIMSNVNGQKGFFAVKRCVK